MAQPRARPSLAVRVSSEVEVKALVTGSSGFIGRHIVKRLIDDKWNVVQQDILEGYDCRTIFATNDHFDLVVHCAAVIGGRANMEGDPLSVATDFALDSDFLRFVERTRPERSVYFSSSAVYPVDMQHESQSHRLAESDLCLAAPRLPDEMYGWVKLTGEKIISYMNHRPHVFRPFSGYGSDQDLSYPFPKFIDRAVTGQDPFKIWSSGDQMRDWVHVDDIVNFVMVALEQPPDVWNICSGEATSMYRLAEQTMRAAGSTAPIRVVKGKPMGVMRRVGDPAKMHKLYRPIVNLEEGVRRAVEEHRGSATV